MAATVIRVFVALVAAACGPAARVPIADGIGPNPVLPPPSQPLIPTVVIAPAKGWRSGESPTAASGMSVTAFARGLDHPRGLYVLPNGDVLVVETNAPHRPDDSRGIKGWFFKRYQKAAGAGVPSPNRITLLRDADGDGVAELRTEFLGGLASPFGVALVGDALYVANTDAVVRFPYKAGETHITAPAVVLTALPAGPINHHWTKSLVASADGRRLYVGVGSNSNIVENGIEQEAGRAAVWEIDRETGRHRVFASGLRNPAGLSWEPERDRLWASVNERDELGSDLVPDYMTAVRDGGFYGWPYSYFGSHPDARAKPARPDLVAAAIVPDYALGPHTSSLGLAYSRGPNGAKPPAPYDRGMFVGQHGSWNRNPMSGYKVIFVSFAGGAPVGMPRDVLTGFVDDRGNARGRPVGVAIDGRGALLVADDVGNTVWRVTMPTGGR